MRRSWGLCWLFEDSSALKYRLWPSLLLFIALVGCSPSDESAPQPTQPDESGGSRSSQETGNIGDVWDIGGIGDVEDSAKLLLGIDPESQSSADSNSTVPWRLFIAAHTSGVISRHDRIEVRFVLSQVSDEEVGQPVASRLVLDPPVEGRASWSNRRTFVFIPSQPLESGARYRARISLAGLSGFPGAKEIFDFGFGVIRQELEIRVVGLSAEGGDAKQRVLSGDLVTADRAAPELVEKVLRAEHRGSERRIHWVHGADGRSHRFVVDGIPRQRGESFLKLSWDGSPIGARSNGSEGIEIPALGRFEVTRMQARTSPSQGVVIRFSDSLAAGQDLTGLVRIGGKDVRATVSGNTIRAHPAEPMKGSVVVRVEAGIRNVDGDRLARGFSHSVEFPIAKPGVRFAGKGVILPQSDVLSIPIEAVAVDSVQVTAFRVYEDNIAQFLQSNDLDGDDDLKQVGRYLWRKTIDLNPAASESWTRYALDASELLRAEPGSIVRLELSINRGNSTYACPAEAEETEPRLEKLFRNYDDARSVEASHWDTFEQALGGTARINWREREDPCKDSYFHYSSDASAARNFLPSNIGILAKRGDSGAIHITTTDLRSAEPLAGVELELRSFQNRHLAGVTSDAQGFAVVDPPATPFALIARKGEERGYLKLATASALPTSHFDVGGEKVNQGLKGHLYAERGVWRPGDEIHLVFVLRDPEGKIPREHPVSISLFDPKGREVETQTNIDPIGRFYAFTLRTEEEAPTGRWLARAQLGGMSFEKVLRIETVIPNRLKVQLDFERELLLESEMPLSGEVFGQWLHGADASGLKADVELRLSSRETRFSRNVDYTFDDPARRLDGAPENLFEGELDETGHARFEADFETNSQAPGMLSAHFTTRVFEEGGGFSTDRVTIPYSPYERYVGIRLPKGDSARGMLLTDERQEVQIATLDSNGEPVSAEGLDVRLYKIDWKWWWDRAPDSLARFASASYNQTVELGTASTRDGIGSWSFEIHSPKWGRYLLRVCDPKGGHCAGKTFYIDWPGWAGRAQPDGGPGASALTLTSDKPKYRVGETAKIRLPAARQGRALLSLETGSRVLAQRWIDFEEVQQGEEGEQGERDVEIAITRDMAPNVYVSATLLQPHQGKQNDRPIRLYGTIPLEVEDPQTRLQPSITAPDEIKPRETFELEVSEQDGQSMIYTVAIVDEGLLGLTRYTTPDLHRAFYRREALGVRTWDLYDYVIGAYGGELERLLALGGDGSAEPVDPRDEKKRFPPVVRFLGPFGLEVGETAIHEVELPDTIGAVRIMLVAGSDDAYGSAQKSVFVRDKLMLLATLPRVLGPGEEFRLPATVFVTDPDIEDVVVELDVDGHFEVQGESLARLQFQKPGDQLAFFTVKTQPHLGQGHVALRARAEGANAAHEVAIDIRAPNPETLRQVRRVLQPGERWSSEVVPHGMAGTNRIGLEVSSVPPMNLGRRLHYLIRYPYGCVEQLTSSVFPQLFLPSLVRLEEGQAKEVQSNVSAGIGRLRAFQMASGGFAYWPGSHRGESDWGTSYAGHFLVEASRLGYHIPVGMLSDWLAFQRRAAQSWLTGGGRSALGQAYRLYTLALAGKPEMGAMNRLREGGRLASPTRWLLAAAYRRAAQPEAADELVRRDDFAPGAYDTTSASFGSALRDRAIFLLGLVELGRREKAGEMAEHISAELARDHWYSTQSTAFSLMALAHHVGGAGDEVAFSFSQSVAGAEVESVVSDAPIHREEWFAFPEEGGAVELENTSSRVLYASISSAGVPPAGTEKASSRDLQIDVVYKDLAGEPIDLTRLEQGRDFVVEVVVTNTLGRAIENLALAHVMPSGWEIRNPRMELGESKEPASFDSQDVRDDRVYTYFGLKQHEKKRFSVLLNAAYLGRFYQPSISVEAMYDAAVHARTQGLWVEVAETAEMAEVAERVEGAEEVEGGEQASAGAQARSVTRADDAPPG